MQTLKLNVDGMSCSHCENSIKNALNSLKGVSNVNIDLNLKTVEIVFENLEVDLIKQTIENLGFDVIN